MKFFSWALRYHGWLPNALVMEYAAEFGLTENYVWGLVINEMKEMGY